MDSSRFQMAGPEHHTIPFYPWKQRPQSAHAGPRSHSAHAAESAGKPGGLSPSLGRAQGSPAGGGRDIGWPLLRGGATPHLANVCGEPGENSRGPPLRGRDLPSKAGFYWAFVCAKRHVALDGRWRRGPRSAGECAAGLHRSVTQARAREGRSRACRSSAPSGGGRGRGRVRGGAVPCPARSPSSGQRREGPAPGCE